MYTDRKSKSRIKQMRDFAAAAVCGTLISDMENYVCRLTREPFLMEKNVKRFAALAVCMACFMLPAVGCRRIDDDRPVYMQIISEEEQASVKSGSYYYNQLSEEEQGIYDIIREAAVNFEETAYFDQQIPTDVLRKIFIALYYSESDIFWLDSVFYSRSMPSDNQRLSYRFSKEEVPAMQKAVDDKTSEILSQFDTDTSDYQKLKAFHDYIVLNCTFSEDTPYSNTVYGALADGYAQCEGYAFAFEHLCRAAGIECFTVKGTGITGQLHAWNMVLLEGQWYYVDCTWDDPILETPDSEFIRYYYFLVCDADISGVTHIADNTYFSLPICAGTENYYKREGFYAYSADEGIEMLKDAVARTLSLGGKNAAVRFDSKRDFNTAYSKLFDSNGMKEILRYGKAQSGVSISESRYVRYVNEDEFIIHISMTEE